MKFSQKIEAKIRGKMIFASLFCDRTNVLDIVVHLYYNKKIHLEVTK
jgi:hypothetical protein